MTRATRFAATVAAAAIVYLVFALGIIPVPLISANIADKILPTVRRAADS